MKASIALYERLWRHNGGDARLGHRNRAILRAAGFTQILTTSRSVDFPIHLDAAFFAEAFLSSRIADPVVRFGWADRAALGRYAQAWSAWGQNPDAVSIGVVVQSVGRRE
jgi:hypothetical protein